MNTSFVKITLPSTSTREFLFLNDGGGRDQVVAMIRADWSEFERPLPAILHACASRLSGLVVDVGANSGFYSLLAATSCATSRVIAFEPEYGVGLLLKRNIAINKLGSRVLFSNHALSDRSGSGQLYVPTQEHGLVETSSSLEKAFKDAHSEIRQIKIISLDKYFHRVIPRLIATLRKLTLLKIDVEGHEPAVLRGGAATIARFRPIIFIEVLPGADVSFHSKFIAETGYVDIPLSLAGLAAHKTVKFFEDAWNHAFVPMEKSEMFLSIARPLI